MLGQDIFNDDAGFKQIISWQMTLDNCLKNLSAIGVRPARRTCPKRRKPLGCSSWKHPSTTEVGSGGRECPKTGNPLRQGKYVELVVLHGIGPKPRYFSAAEAGSARAGHAWTTEQGHVRMAAHIRAGLEETLVGEGRDAPSFVSDGVESTTTCPAPPGHVVVSFKGHSTPTVVLVEKRGDEMQAAKRRRSDCRLPLRRERET
ncbi:unnamed protein product [Heligmosomoides polygyrus]|uniref:Uncharacterized protein n=1 Tax=Heligmosomoides polygyrus TaxID=6339 RepID=A0A183FLC7_HELPZ|nr:unnamed protein product [Heligmosomoides polygyrus]